MSAQEHIKWRLISDSSTHVGLIRLQYIRGRWRFVRFDSKCQGLPLIHHRGAWRPSTYRSVA